MRVRNPQVSILVSQHKSGSRSVGQKVARSQASSASSSSPAHLSNAGFGRPGGLCSGAGAAARRLRRDPRRGTLLGLATAILSPDPPAPSEKSTDRGRSGDPKTRSRGGASPFRGFFSVLPFLRFGEARYFNDRARAGSVSDDEARFVDDGFLAGASLAGV